MAATPFANCKGGWARALSPQGASANVPAHLEERGANSATGGAASAKGAWWGMGVMRESAAAQLRRFCQAGLCALALIGGAMLPAASADLPPPAQQPAKTASGWEYQATFYIWGTALTGDVGVRDLPSMPVNASFGDLLSHLDGALMGSFFAKNGDWMLLGDIYWAKLATDEQLGALNQATASYTQKLFIASGVAGYRLPVGGSDVDLYATAGFRYQRLTADVSVTSFLPPIAVGGEAVKDWLDPVFGLALQYHINDKWFLNALADVGGFGLGSKLTSQGFVAVGYNWTQQWSSALGYRALYTDYKSVTGPRSNFRYDATMHGPFMSLAYHF